MDNRSELYLMHVHPALAEVMRSAAQTPQGFLITYGLRTASAEAEAVATGHSHTMHSRHLPNIDGLACAVDTAAIIGGHLDYAKGREAEVFGKIAAQVKAAADKLLIPIQWGGAPVGAWTPGVVSHFRDWGHFQLPWKEYP